MADKRRLYVLFIIYTANLVIWHPGTSIFEKMWHFLFFCTSTHLDLQFKKKILKIGPVELQI